MIVSWQTLTMFVWRRHRAAVSLVGTCVRAIPCFQAVHRRLPSTPYACYLMPSHLHADTKMAFCACLTCANQGATLLALPFVPKPCLISSRSALLLLQCSFGNVAAKCPCHHANCGTKSFWRRLAKAAVGLQYVHYLCLSRSNSLFHCCIVFFFEFALVSSAFFIFIVGFQWMARPLNGPWRPTAL
jgi:hypothetical protein